MNTLNLTRTIYPLYGIYYTVVARRKLIHMTRTEHFNSLGRVLGFAFDNKLLQSNIFIHKQILNERATNYYLKQQPTVNFELFIIKYVFVFV